MTKTFEKYLWKSSCFSKESQCIIIIIIIIILFGLKIATIFWRKETNNIKMDTNKNQLQ